ncbi:MAG: LamG-like jellyroll fold domain-containing protein [Chloroflexota bacterium]
MRSRHAIRIAALAVVVALVLIVAEPVLRRLWPRTPGVLVGAGDIASCESEGDEATAGLLDRLDGVVVTLGDNAYGWGRPEEFEQCYGPSWGRHIARTMPTPGNHDYLTGTAHGYFQYFGPSAGGASGGYYSYNLGAWHIVALNSNCGDGWDPEGCEPDSEQVAWLAADLAANPTTCTLAYFHHPLFSSGLEHNVDLTVLPIWQVLYEAGVDVVLNGHDHDYERFATQDPYGQPDSRGIRQFVVGTGGESLRPQRFPLVSNSEVFNSDAYGVIKLTLRDGGYDWEFVPVDGAEFRDAGSGVCIEGQNPAPVLRKRNVQAVMDDRPAGFWRLNDRDGVIARDVLGMAHGAYDQRNPPGPGALLDDPDLAAAFDGRRSRVVVGDLFDFSENAPFSFAVWVYPSVEDRAYRRVLSKDAYDGRQRINRGWALSHQRGEYVFFRYGADGVGTEAVVRSPLPLGEWSHLAGVYDGAVMRLYKNGREVASAESAVRLPDLGEPFTIGASASGADYFRGRIDEVAIFDYALSAEQVRDQFLVNAPRRAPRPQAHAATPETR